MSPEGVAYAMQEYLEMLNHQVGIAKSFFLGKMAQGMEGLMHLPEDLRLNIDQWIWEAAGGLPIDPSEKESGKVIAAAMMRSLEEQMGMDEI